jgi:hypothetical protein
MNIYSGNKKSKRMQDQKEDIVSLKFIDLMPKLVTLESVFHVNVYVPVILSAVVNDELVQQPFRDCCRMALDTFFNQLLDDTNCIFCVEESKELVVLNSADDEKRKVGSSSLMVSIKVANWNPVAHKKHCIYLHLKQNIHATVNVVKEKTALVSAMKQLRRDIITSILNRFDLFCDVMTRDPSSEYSQLLENEHLDISSLQNKIIFHLPIRTFDKSLTFCDYLLLEESEKDSKQRFLELLGIESEITSKEVIKTNVYPRQENKSTLSTTTVTNNESNAFMQFIVWLIALIMSLFGKK